MSQSLIVSDLDPARPAPTEWGPYAKQVRDDWSALLASDPDEQPVQEFLELHPCLLPGAFGDVGPGGHHGPHLRGVFREPPLKGLGRDQQPDFMWITRSTSLVTPVLVEIEKPGRHWFTKAGDPTAEVTHARQQLNRWRAWFAEPENQAIFKQTYLRGQYANRRLLPQYLLIYGRATEFEPGLRHHDPDALRKVRDEANQPDMQAMTFDSLSPSFDRAELITLTMGALGPKVHAIQAPFTTGPGIAGLAAQVLLERDALDRTAGWSVQRRDYVFARWQHWTAYGRNPNGQLLTGQTGE